MNKLNLGSGFHTHPDYVNVDKLDYGNNLIADVLERLPFIDNTFDFVLMNHTLQMFTYEELPVVLKEVRRVMKAGATLRILTPDIDKAVVAYDSNDRAYFPIDDSIETSLQGKFARYLFWHGDTRCAFGVNSMRDLLFRNNFIMKESGVKFGQCDLDSRERESLVVEAIK